MINILLLALIACGDEEKEDTSKLEIEVEETQKEESVPAEEADEE